MSDVALDASELRPTRRANERPNIPLANGDFLEPRRQWAVGIGISDKTASRMNLPTTYVGNVAYVAHNASLKIVADGVRQRRNPQRRIRGRG